MLLMMVFIFNFTISSFMLTFFQSYILYSEEYFTLTSDIIYTTVQLITVWKKVLLSSLLYYLLLSAGYSITMLSIKVFIIISIMIGNIIDVYLLGVMVVLINNLTSIAYFSFLIIGYLLYLFLTSMELFLVMLFMLESFSIIFQSLTLSNRLSINIVAGSLLISLMSMAVMMFANNLMLNFMLIILLLIMYCFEMINSLIQLSIINLLTIEYLNFSYYCIGFLFSDGFLLVSLFL